MNKKTIGGCLALFILSAFVVAGCQSAEVKTPVAGPLASIKIMPEMLQVTEGTSLELTAVGYDATGIMVSVTPKWSQLSGLKAGKLEIPKVAGNKAIFNGLKAGSATIQVVQNGIKANATITVQRPIASQVRNMK